MQTPELREQRYRAFIENCSEAFWCIEFSEPIPVDLPPETQIELAYQRGFVSDANRTLAKMYGFQEAADLVGAPLSRFMPKEANLDYLTSFIAAGYRMTDAESEEQDQHGAKKYFLNNLLGICENEQLIRVWGTQRDVTDRKQLEKLLRQSNQLEALGRLLGGVAHDFNDLLSVILTVSSLLESEVAPDLKNDVSMIREAALRGGDLTKTLISLAQKHLVRLRRLDLNGILSGLDRMLRALAGDKVVLDVRLAPDLWSMRADAGGIEQLILNLVVNSCDSMGMVGKISIETMNVERATGQHVMLLVRDTAKGRGGGLGMELVHGMVKHCRGTVLVETEPGVGTRFTILFPRET